MVSASKLIILECVGIGRFWQTALPPHWAELAFIPFSQWFLRTPQTLKVQTRTLGFRSWESAGNSDHTSSQPPSTTPQSLSFLCTSRGRRARGDCFHLPRETTQKNQRELETAATEISVDATTAAVSARSGRRFHIDTWGRLQSSGQTVGQITLSVLLLLSEHFCGFFTRLMCEIKTKHLGCCATVQLRHWSSLSSLSVFHKRSYKKKIQSQKFHYPVEYCAISQLFQ